MTSPFDTIWNDGAATVMASLFGDTVTLRRGALTTSDVTAQKFLGERTINLEDGGVIKFSGCGWIIAKSAYVFSGAESDPRAGDRIIESDSAEWSIAPTEEMAEAMELPGGTEWLVMTKRVSA